MVSPTPHPGGRGRRAAFLLAFLLVAPGLSRAGSYVLTLQPDASQTDDSYLREDGVTERNGTKSELRLKAAAYDKNRNIVVRFPTSALANKTVLQAWLSLNQSAGNSSAPIDARIYPLIESWDESVVSWRDRSQFLVVPTAWTTPGGTYRPTWTDRKNVSEEGVGKEVLWQVGPIIQAWRLGTLAADGFLIRSEHGAPDREVVFRSSEVGTASQRPKLVLHYTDEAPAIRSGVAETQPRVLQVGATNAHLTLSLDLEASGGTPTGNATGVDQITIAHGDAFVVTALESFQVGGSPAMGPVTFTDNGSSVTIKCPRIQSNAKVRVDMRVTVLSGANSSGVDLPVTVDDTATPGAWAQALWPGEADGTAGNGDDWILQITAVTPTRIQVLPDTARVVQRLCTSFSVVATDLLGNSFPVQADSFLVLPSSAGAISRDGIFCASQAGTAKVLAFYGTLRDTAIALISPALTPQVTSIQLRKRDATATTTLAPADTMLLDVVLSDGDGFQDVRRLDFDLFYAGSDTSLAAPALHAGFRWTRGTPQTWSLIDPLGTSWKLIPERCSVDSITNATTPQTIRLAFLVGQIARASASGEWSAAVRMVSATPPDTSRFLRTGLGCSPRVVVSLRDTAAAFNSGEAGATHLPLARPTDGHLSIRVLSNAAWNLLGSASDLAGTFLPGDTIFVRAPNQRIAWSLNSAGTGGGTIDDSDRALGPTRPPATAEQSQEQTLHLWIDHPVTIPAQNYAGSLRLRISAPGFASADIATSMPITASVVSGGLAAQSVLAEILPHIAAAGSTGTPFDLYLLPQVRASDTGINRILVDLPDGYGTTSVSTVEVAGNPVAFGDRSGSGMADVVLGARLTSSSLVRLRLLTQVPTELDSAGAGFVTLIDDTATALPAQAAIEGNANGVSDGNSWIVSVAPGPLAEIELSPSAATAYVGGTISFTAVGYDAYKHPVQPSVVWSVQGGIGSISSSGVFSASSAGSGRVIARSGGLADTAQVTVWAARAIAARSVRGPATTYQGATGVPLTLRVENLGGVPVVLDTVRLAFSRGAAGDADGDFTVIPSASNPDTVPVGASVTLRLAVDVSSTALVGPLSVNARVSGVEVNGGIRLTDAAADTTLALDVRPGGFELSSSQTAGAVRPGQRHAHLLTLRLRNLDPDPHELRRLTLVNRSVGPGAPEILDGELGDVSIFLDDGDGVLDAAKDTLVLTTAAVDGRVNVVPLSVPLPGGAERRLLVACTVPLGVRDGDALDVSVDAADDLEFERKLGSQNPWPVHPSGSLTIDGMTAEQIATLATGKIAIAPGSVDVPVFRLVLPPNGYQTDQLQRLAVVNQGTARPDSELTRVRAWVDDGDGSFAAGDRLLGTLFFTGDRWQLSGLSENVPLAGLPMFFTVDLSSRASERRTIQLALPSGLDPGVGLTSGNSGPIDKELASPEVQTVSSVDRITLTAMPIEDGVARPGDPMLPILHLVASNSYSSTRTLTALVLANQTLGPGGAAELDREIQQLTLRADGDGDGALDGPDVDPVLATGFFESARASWSGLSWSLAPSGSRHLWVTADPSISGAADGDQIGAAILSGADIGFAEPTTVTAEWPVDSRGRWTVDGLVAAQVGRNPVPALSLGPGEGPALALDLVVPPNGYRTDLLRGIFVVNLGTAGASDLDRLELWRDGGDGVFTAGGDDASLGVLVPQGGGWQSPLLATTVAPPGVRLFVAATVSGAPAESTTVRLALPIDGIQFDSGNDGPNDAAIESPDGLLLSRSPLLATIDCPAASALDQTIEVRMRIRNVGSERVDGIAPSALQITGPAAFSWVEGPTPATIALDPGEADTVSWRHVATAVGETRFVAGASGIGTPSGLVRRAPVVGSGLHRVFTVASRADLVPVQTMPVNVNPGQTGVVPFSLTLSNPGGPGVSDIRLRGVRVRLETESEQPIVPSDLLSRVSINEGAHEYLVKTALETSGNTIDLTLATPALITGIEPTTLSLRLDLSGSTTVPTVRVVIADSSEFTAEDATSQAPVTVVMETGAYPLRSSAARVVAPATDLDVTAAAPDTVRVSRGAMDVPLLRARLENRGIANITADARSAGFSVVVHDSAGSPTPAESRLGEVRVMEGTRLQGSLDIGPGSGSGLTLALSPPLNLPADVGVDVMVVGDVAADAALGAFRVALVDSGAVVAYDANSRAPLAVHLSPSALLGDWVLVEAPADTLLAAHTPSLPPTIVVGQTGVVALRASLRHPDGPGAARIRLDTLVVGVRDEQRHALPAADYLDRARVLVDGAEVGSLAGLPAGSSFALPLGGFLLAPGDTARLELRVDVDAGAPTGSLELVVSGSGVIARDANSDRVVALVPEAGSELPMLSGVTRLASPSRVLVVGLRSRMPAVLASDGRPVTAAEVTLSNRDPQGTGAIQVASLTIQGANEDGTAIALGSFADRVEAWVGGSSWAQSANLGPDSSTAILVAAQPLLVPQDATSTVDIRWVPRAGAAGRVRIGIDRPGVGVVQPPNALLMVQIQPEDGQVFPMWTESGGFGTTDLAGSYSNFPNPFAAGRQSTAFAYYLRAPGSVSLRIFTPRGERVVTLLDGAARAAGQHQEDLWDGRNGGGGVVLNGVYVAELQVRFDDGASERRLRKVAVVR